MGDVRASHSFACSHRPMGGVRASHSEAATTSAMPLRFCFVQIVERIFQRHSPDAAEPGFFAKLTDLRLMKTERAESFAIVRERSSHAVKHAYAMKHGA